MANPTLDLLVVGSGPSGLSCAIEAQRAGLKTIVLEKGSVVDAIRRFPQNMVWFSTPELLSIGDVPFVVSTTRPTRVDTLNYYQKVVRHCNLDVRCHDEVISIKKVEDGFDVGTAGGKAFHASYVVIATGYFDHPGRLGIPGEELPHVHHYYDEPFRYFGSDVAVVGGRNSAVEAALDLYRHGARVTLIHRGASLSQGVKYWILPDMENRIKAGEIKVLFSSTVKEMRPRTMRVKTSDGETEIPADFVFVLIGFQPDSTRLLSFGIELDPESLAPRCREGSLETTIRGLYVAGSVVAGRNTNSIFVENGRLHGRQIVTELLAKT